MTDGDAHDGWRMTEAMTDLRSPLRSIRSYARAVGRRMGGTADGLPHPAGPRPSNRKPRDRTLVVWGVFMGLMMIFVVPNAARLVYRRRSVTQPLYTVQRAGTGSREQGDLAACTKSDAPGGRTRSRQQALRGSTCLSELCRSRLRPPVRHPAPAHLRPRMRGRAGVQGRTYL